MSKNKTSSFIIYKHMFHYNNPSRFSLDSFESNDEIKIIKLIDTLVTIVSFFSLVQRSSLSL